MKNFKKICLAFFLLGIVCLSACKTPERAAENDVTPKEIYYDIEAVKVSLSSSYSAINQQYDPEPFVKLQEEVMAGKVNRIETIYRLKQILSGYHIVHLQIYPIIDWSAEIEIIPLQFCCFSSGYYVAAADKKYSNYLGWKLKGIGDLSINEAVDRIAEFSSIETPAGKKYPIESLLRFEDFYYYGLTDNGKIQFTLESKDGTTEVLNCKPIDYKKASFELLQSKKLTSFTNRITQTNYGVIGVPEISTLYLPYTQFGETAEYTLSEWLDDILKELRSYTYKTIVFDLRYNPGGQFDQMLYQRFFNTNKEELEKYNIAVVTTGRTASAACWFTNDILNTFPHVKIFGEETAQAVFNNTGIRPQVLKKLNCNFSFPINVGVGNFPKLIERSTDIYRGIMPDVEVLEDFESTLNGEDAIYKAIYEYYNK